MTPTATLLGVFALLLLAAAFFLPSWRGRAAMVVLATFLAVGACSRTMAAELEVGVPVIVCDLR